MRRIPMGEAIETLVEEYRQWLEEVDDNVVTEWLRVCDQHATVVDGGGDPPELYLDVEEPD